MSELGAPPPIYSRQQEGANSRVENESLRENSEVQMLICPSSDFQFQKGFLGVDGERAAIEGEIQIKGAHTDSWEAVTISLLTTESFDGHQVELNHVQMTLFSRSQPSSSSTIPSSIPFSLPLTPDTSQCIHTPRSSLLHTLSVTLHPVDFTYTPLTRSVTVHARRFSSRRLVLDISPRTVILEFPARVEIQIPRAIFRSNEIIPIYFVIPPPDRSVVLDQGYTLRNIRAELIRKITISDEILENETSKSLSSDDPLRDSDSSSSIDEPPSAAFLTSLSSASFSPASRNEDAFHYIGEQDNSYESTISRSGVSCRFHSSRTVRLRLLLAASSPSSFSHVTPSDLSDSNNAHGEAPDDAQCASISQSSLIHSVNFFLRVHATYLRSLSHTEFVSNHSIPLVILPPPALLPEVEPSVDAAYYKKHDQPPAKTVRLEDPDLYPYEYENHAGPSAHQLGSPPPFDDAPPPFSSSTAETSASSRLPTFLESEIELHIPAHEHPAHNSLSLPESGDIGIEGEGRLFGFPASEQYDGHSDELRRTSTPPPTMDMARDDTDVSQFVVLLSHPERVLHALNMTSEQSHDLPNVENALPPPPPPMDDPSDPPPSIDSDYRTHVSEPPPSIDSDYHNVNAGPTTIAFRPSPTSTLSVRTDVRPSIRDNISNLHSQPSSPQHTNDMNTDRVTSLDISSPEHSMLSSPGSQAPPPYLNSLSLDEQDRLVAHPPPYMDFLPSEPHS